MNDITTNHKGKGIPIRAGKFVVGEVRGDTFYKTVSGSKHFKTKPAGIANDVSVLHDAKIAGAAFINVTDRETHLKYTATIALIFDKGIYFNQGHGDQINLLFPYWSVTAMTAPASESNLTPSPKYSEPTVTKTEAIQLTFSWMQHETNI